MALLLGLSAAGAAEEKAGITMADGKQLFTDGLPFSFTCGGRLSAELLPAWKHEEKKEHASAAGRELRTITWTDPATGLEVRAEITLFKDPPAVDWVLRFTNAGKADSPILEAVLPLDLRIGVPAGDVILHRARGSTAGATDFLPVDEKLAPNASVSMAPNGGCSSDGVLPFFNMEWSGGGLAWAVGWSGQWSQRIQRDSAGRVEIKAGQQTFRAKLRPGESVRTPRILLVCWQGADRMRGHNQLRRTILAHYSPRLDGEVAMPPIAQHTWFKHNTGNGTTEENQLQHIRAMPALGVETFWLDAGWFEGGWPNGFGNWVPNASHFPRGLKPLGDEAHRLGLKFLLWFAPELVNPNSRIAREHPEFVLSWKDVQKGDGLFNLGDPVARAWLTDHLSKRIGEWGVDIYRTDFGGQPLLYWQKKDAADRQGITENHYVAGLYAMWDELRRRHPRLLFDDCASGGRRIDLEMISRSYVLCRSDSVSTKASSSAWDQAQTAGLSLYVPVNATLSTCGIPQWSSQGISLYALRSAATSGFSIGQDTFAKDFPADLFKKVVAEVKQLRPMHNGDFYPLTPIGVNEDAWCAWQFDRPDLGQGFAMFFRRPKAAQAAFEAMLHGLDPKASYEVTFVDGARTQKLTGEDLARLKVEIPGAPGSLLVVYRKLDRLGGPPVIHGLTGKVSGVGVAVEAPSEVALLPKDPASKDIDLKRMAGWAMNYLIRTPRKELNYEPVFQCYPLRCPPVPAGHDVVVPCDTDARLNWEWYYMRDVSGSEAGKDIEAAFHKRLLEYVQEDGTVLAPIGAYNEGDIHKVYKKEDYVYHVWGATKILFALAEDFRRTHNPESKATARRVMLRLKKLAVYPTPDRCYFPAGMGAVKQDGAVVPNGWNKMPAPAIIALVNYHRSTGDAEALAFAKAYAEGIMAGAQPGGLRFGADGNFIGGHSHTTMHALWGIAELALVTGDERYTNFVKRSWDWMLSLGTGTGWFPATTPFHPTDETCLTSDMMSNAACIARGGHPEYFDFVERYLRNRIGLLQFIITTEFEAEYRRVNAQAGEDKVRAGLAELRKFEGGIQSYTGLDDYENSRLKGTYAGLAGCCAPEGMRAIYTAWNNTIDRLEASKLGPAGVYVNLSFNRTSPWGRVASFLPDTGRLTVQVAAADAFFLRPPHWAPREQVRAFVGAREVQAVWSGAYIRFDGGKPGDELTITYPLMRFTHAPTGPWKEKMKPAVDLNFDWIGNIIVGSRPQPEGTPLFTGKSRQLPNPPETFGGR